MTCVRTFLQYWLRCRLQRKQYHRAALILSVVVIHSLARSESRVKSAVDIAAAWRGFRRRKYYRLDHKSMLVLGSKLRVLLRRFRYRQQIKKSVDMNCRRSECGLAGRILFKHSSILETQRQIIRQSVIRESVHASDLQRIFNTYCSYGQRGNTTRLGVGNFARLIKETPCVMQPTNPTGLSQSDVELTFMKYRGRSKQLTVGHQAHRRSQLTVKTSSGPMMNWAVRRSEIRLQL